MEDRDMWVMDEGRQRNEEKANGARQGKGG